jgi:fatty-acyl-CoA synthase
MRAAPHRTHWPQRLPRELRPPRVTLWSLLATAADRYADAPGYLYLGQTWTWRRLHDEALAVAGWLHARGVRRGDRVALFMQNCPQFVIACQAVFRADAVVVPINPMNRADELAYQLADSGAKVLVCSGEGLKVALAAQADIAPQRRLAALLVTTLEDTLVDQTTLEPEIAPSAAVLDALASAPPRAEWPAAAAPWSQALLHPPIAAAHVAQPDDLALLPYTSGTTGHPKGCMHSHASLMPNVVGGAQWSHITAESVGLGVVPMFHITGMVYSVLGPAWTGHTVVLMPRWDRELAARLIARHRVSHWVCIPTMVIDLLGSPNAARFDLSSLRYLSGGGAAMPQAVAERLREQYGLVFSEGYGLTETAAPSHGNPPERAKLQCLGMPIFGVDSRVVDPATLEEMPIGETGEIVTAGPMLFHGYWGHPDATAAAFVELEGRRYFRTGDLGRIDEDGYFFIVDRLKRMINASGFKVWPSEVELMLFKCPGVQEACVIAARDAYRGETVKACIVLRDEARGRTSAEDVIAWAREHMAAYKVPRIVEFVDVLPKSGSGKVMWRLLQERELADPS